MNKALEKETTEELVFELKLRGYVAYKKPYFWHRVLRCPCGARVSEETINKGVYTFICGKCGRTASGRNDEKAIRAWNLQIWEEME